VIHHRRSFKLLRVTFFDPSEAVGGDLVDHVLFNHV
jgi:hypothetical protein